MDVKTKCAALKSNRTTEKEKIDQGSLSHIDSSKTFSHSLHARQIFLFGLLREWKLRVSCGLDFVNDRA